MEQMKAAEQTIEAVGLLAEQWWNKTTAPNMDEFDCATQIKELLARKK